MNPQTPNLKTRYKALLRTYGLRHIPELRGLGFSGLLGSYQNARPLNQAFAPASAGHVGTCSVVWAAGGEEARNLGSFWVCVKGVGFVGFETAWPELTPKTFKRP